MLEACLHNNCCQMDTNRLQTWLMSKQATSEASGFFQQFTVIFSKCSLAEGKSISSCIIKTKTNHKINLFYSRPYKIFFLNTFSFRKVIFSKKR